MNFLEFIKRKTTTDQLINMVSISVSENEVPLVELQKDQWSKGEDKFGQTIGVYKPFTQKVAREESPNTPKIAGEPYNLNWTGDLMRSTNIKTRKVTNDLLVQIDSTSSNLLPLFDTIERYGLLSNPNTIFGYQNEKKDVATRLINKGTLRKLKQKYNV